MYLNFGNGIIAGGTAKDSVRIYDFVGLDVPLAETTFQEHGVLDGGTYAATRIPTRAMAISMTTRDYSRHDIMAAFRYGERFTISSERGSMPYYVEGLVFDRANQTGPTRFTVSIRSPQAYPTLESVVVTAGSSSAMGWPHEWPHSYDTLTAVSSIAVELPVGSLTAEAIIRLTAASSGDIAITHAGGTFTVAVTAGDVVVIDSLARTVTIDGTLSMGEFTRDSVWPVIVAGRNTITFSQTVMAVVEYPVMNIGLV